MTARNQASSNRLACLLVCLLAMLGRVPATIAEDVAPADVNHKLSIEIELLEDAVPSTQSARVESHDGSAETIEIALGDPLALRVALKNESEAATEPMPASLDPLWMPAFVVVAHPDGRSTLGSIRDARQIRVPPMIRPIKAGERLVADVCAYTNFGSGRCRGERLGYLFPSPGQFDVYVAYFTRLPMWGGGEDERFADHVLDRINRKDGVLLSNTVRVKVGPAIPGWEELCDAGLAQAVRRGFWISEHFSHTASRSRIDALVEQSGRDWLRAWYAEVEKSDRVLPATAPDPPLSLTIRAMATEVVVGEPIVLEVTLRNIGDETIDVSKELARSGEIARYFMSTNGNEFRQLAGSLSERVAPSVALPSGDCIRHLEWLHWDFGASKVDDTAPTLITRIAGRYEIYMQYPASTDRVENNLIVTSARVEVEVIEPHPENIEHLSVLSRRDMASAIDRGLIAPASVGSHQAGADLIAASAKLNETLEDLARTQTPYAAFAALLRGSFELAQQDHNLRGGELVAAQEARARRALEYLEPADKEGFPLRSEAVWYIREAAVLLGDDEAVERLTKRLETEYADTHAAKRPVQSKKYTP